MSEVNAAERPKHVFSQPDTPIPLGRDVLDILARDGLITPEMRQSGLLRLHPPHRWGQWGLVLLAVSGTVLILSGIVFFFAFNWGALSSFQKFAMLQAAVMLTAAGAALLSRKLLLSQLLLLASSVLVGVFLAVFGQIYQTGADPWQLFALWALLILPWTCLSGFVLQWLLWLALINLSLILWWDQMPWIWAAQEEGLMASLALLNGGFLIVREAFAHKSGFGWLRALWTRWILAGMVLMPLFIPLLTLLTADASSSLEIGSGLLALCSYGLVFVCYRLVWPDVPVLTMWSLSCCLLLILAFSTLASDWGWNDIVIVFLASRRQPVRPPFCHCK